MVWCAPFMNGVHQRNTGTCQEWLMEPESRLRSLKVIPRGQECKGSVEVALAYCGTEAELSIPRKN